MNDQMARGDLECRYTEKPGNVTFQIFNKNTGNMLVGPLETFDTKNDAILAWHELADGIVARVLATGGRLLSKNDNGISFMADPDAFDAGSQPQILVGIINNTADNKYGVALFVNHDMVIKPDQWFDDPKEAYQHYLNNREHYKEQLEDLGYTDITLVATPDEVPDFEECAKSTFKLPGINEAKDFDATVN